MNYENIHAPSYPLIPKDLEILPKWYSIRVPLSLSHNFIAPLVFHKILINFCFRV
jgi:hypothetical protein